MSINHRRLSAEHCKYIDNDAAIKVHGKNKKDVFIPDNIFYKCFVRAFEYGARKMGYWSYEHLIIQLEDCIDVLRAIYQDRFEIQIMVDHSCGHDRQRDVGLNVHNMNVGYGGNQTFMHESKLSKNMS